MLLLIGGGVALAESWEFLWTREVIESVEGEFASPSDYFNDAPGAPYPRHTVYRVDRFTRKRHGPVLEYFQQTPIREFEGAFDQGVRDGVWTYWERNGRVDQQIRYVDGQEVEYRESSPWWEGGTDQVIPDGVNVEPHGVFEEYYPDTAIVCRRETWHRGYPHGLETEWDPRGHVEEQTWYEHGAHVETRTEPPWFEDNGQVLHGRPVFTGDVADELSWLDVKFWLEIEEAYRVGETIAAPNFEDGQLHGEFRWYGTRPEAVGVRSTVAAGPSHFHLIYVGSFERGLPVGVHSFRGFPIGDDGGVSELRLLWQGRFEDGVCVERRTEPPFWPEDFEGRPPGTPYGTEVGVKDVGRAPRSVGGVSVWVTGGDYEKTVGEYLDGVRHGEWRFVPDYLGYTDYPMDLRVYDRGVLVEERELLAPREPGGDRD